MVRPITIIVTIKQNMYPWYSIGFLDRPGAIKVLEDYILYSSTLKDALTSGASIMGRLRCLHIDTTETGYARLLLPDAKATILYVSEENFSKYNPR
jgi:hypothetical protein